MTYLKYMIILFLLISTCHAQSESKLDTEQWIDIDSIKVRQDLIIQHVTRLGKILPAITLIEIKGGQLAVVLSLNSPEYFNRDKEWVNDFRVIYQKTDEGKETGKLNGESFNIPKGQWVSSLTFLSSDTLLKQDMNNVIIQAKMTKDRMVILDKIEADRIQRDKATDEMIVNVPFPDNVVDQVFDFKLNIYKGKEFDSTKHRGKVILLDFWSTHCAPCLRAMPKLRELSKKYPKDKFEIIGINFDDYENIDDILKQQNINWQQWVVKQEAMQSAIYKKLNFKGIPYYMFINQSGILVKQGYSLEVDLLKDVGNLIN